MKLSELKRLLTEKGAYFVKHGKRHDLWKRNGKTTRVPRHNCEIPEGTLDSILSDLDLK